MGLFLLPEFIHCQKLNLSGQIFDKQNSEALVGANLLDIKSGGGCISSENGSYFDVLIKPLMRPILEDASPFFKNSDYYFFDYNAGINYRIGEKIIFLYLFLEGWIFMIFIVRKSHLIIILTGAIL